MKRILFALLALTITCASAAFAQTKPPSPPSVKAPPAAATGCAQRRVSFSVTRAVGMGSYITQLICSDSRFTVVMDRAGTDGREIRTAFEIKPEEWEKAWQSLERIGWRTFDDKCTPREKEQGRGDGPVYRLTIEEPNNKRSFTCAGARDLADPLDNLQTTLVALAPPEPMGIPTLEVGVKACDDFLNKYETCVQKKVPPGKKQGFLDAILFTRQALHETLMRKPDAEEALTRQCKDMHEAARTAMSTFKCKM
jgi:hypothetical protein